PRRHSVHPDAVMCEAGGEIACQGREPGLRRRVRLTAQRGEGVDRADGHDGRAHGASPKVRNRRAATADDAEEIELEYACPHLVVRVFERAMLDISTGNVDQGVYLTKLASNATYC